MTTIRQTFQQMLERANTPKQRTEAEHLLQVACVKWFRYYFPHLRHNLFAVPNGGRRDKTTGAKMKAEGVLAGVADLLLLKANLHYHGLCIEMKTRKGRQADTQREWQRLIEQDGYKYVICRSLDDFQHEIESYLSNSTVPVGPSDGQ